MITYAIMAAAAFLWLVACCLIYRHLRRTAWLAGPAITASLAVTGLACIASTQVEAPWALAPIWLANGVLCAIHMWSATRSSRLDDDVVADATPPSTLI